MRQLNFENNIKSAGGINLMKELQSAPQRHFGNEMQHSQQYNEIDYRSRRNAAKMAQLLQQQNYQQPDQLHKLQQNKQSQQSIERLAQFQQQDLNSSNNQSKNTSSTFLIPVIKDLNQERMLQRMKSRTIHSEQSSPKMDKNTPSNLNSEFSGYQSNFAKDFSPKISEQNYSQNSMGFNQLTTLVYNQCSVARSQSREKELVQSTNLNSLESEWSKIKRDHNFDNRSQSPFRFHTPVMQGSQVMSYQLSNSNIGNDSKVSIHSNNGISTISKSNADYQLNYRQDGHSSLERSVDSTKKPFENNNSLVNISSKVSKGSAAGEQKQKHKTLIKKSVPLSKINLELVKQEQLSGRQLTAGRKTPKSTSSQSNQKSSQIITTSTTPSNGQSSSSLSNRQHRMSQEGKEESHFQTILDKYQNVHKRQQMQQQQQQNLNNSNLSNNSSSSFQPTNNYQCISTQPMPLFTNLQSDVNNTSNIETASCSGTDNKRQSVYDSRQSFNFKLQKEDSSGAGGQSPQPISQQIYNFSSKIINPTNYHTSPGFSHPIQASQGQFIQNGNKNSNYMTSINQNIPPTQSCYLQNQVQQSNSQIFNNNLQIVTTERQIQAFSVENGHHSQSSSSSKIHNQIKIMSPKQNDLKSISQRSALNKQNSSENMSQLSSSQIQTDTIQQFSHLQKGGIDDVDLTTSKYYGKIATPITNHQQRDVKQLIMNKIHKMNVAKICLKDEEIGTINNSNNQINNSDHYSNSFQNTSEKNELEINRNHGINFVSYSPISSAHGERNPLRSNSPHQHNNLTSSTCSLQNNKTINQMPIVKYQPSSESKKISAKTVNSNTTSPDRHDDISKLGGIDYKIKQVGQTTTQLPQNNNSFLMNNSNQYPYQVYHNPANNQQTTLATNTSSQNIQQAINSMNNNAQKQYSTNANSNQGNKYQINLSQIIQQNNNLKDSNNGNQENYDRKEQMSNPQSQYHVFSSNGSSSTTGINSQNQNQLQQTQQPYYQRINPLQVSTNINRVAAQKVPEQNKTTTTTTTTTIKSAQNDQFNYFSKPQSGQSICKNFVLQPSLEQKGNNQVKNPSFITPQQQQQIYRSNSTEGQFQLGQLQNVLPQNLQNLQKQQSINDAPLQGQRQENENNYGQGTNRTGITKIQYPNQHANNLISYQNNISLTYKPTIPSNNHQNQNLDRLNNGFIQQQQQDGSQAKLQPSIGKSQILGDQGQYGMNSSQKFQDLQVKRSFLTNGSQINNEIPKIKKTGSFFAQ